MKNNSEIPIPNPAQTMMADDQSMTNSPETMDNQDLGMATAPSMESSEEIINIDAQRPYPPYPPYNPPSLTLDTITTVTMPVLSPGNNGDAVRFLQQTLISLGYTIVKFNANFDRYTYLGVTQFQRSNRLKVDGVVGWHTWRKLGEASVSRRRY